MALRGLKTTFASLRLVEARTVADVPGCLWPRLPLTLRANLRILGKLFPKLMKMYQLNVFAAGASASP